MRLNCWIGGNNTVITRQFCLTVEGWNLQSRLSGPKFEICCQIGIAQQHAWSFLTFAEATTEQFPPWSGFGCVAVYHQNLFNKLDFHLQRFQMWDWDSVTYTIIHKRAKKSVFWLKNFPWGFCVSIERHFSLLSPRTEGADTKCILS